MFYIRSLQVKTVLWAAIPVVLVLTVVIIITPHLLEDMSRTVAQQRDVELARISAARLSERLSYHCQSLQFLASSEDLQSMDPPRVKAVLEKAKDQLYLFDCAVAVYNSHGVVICSQPFVQERQGTLFPGSVASKFDEVRRTLRPAFSDIFKDAVSGEDVILVAVPIVKGDGEFTGVLAGIATLRYSLLGAMYAQLLEFKAGRKGYAYLVDSKGRVIYHRLSSQIGQDLTALLPVKKVIANKTGSDLTKDMRGETVIVGFAPVPGTDWGLITQETWDLIIRPIRRDRILLLSLLTIGGVLSAVLILLAVSRVLKPIRNLTTGARRIAEGDFDYTITAKTGDEIQTLSEQFNTMAGALKKSYADLEQRVKERTADLAVAKQKAEEADRLKSDFLATMSHELRTPLNSIIGFTGIMLRGLAGPVTPEQDRQLGMVYKNARHLLDLINDILDLSKIEAEKVTIVKEDVDIVRLIDKVVETTSPLARQKGLKLEVDLSPEIGTIRTDRRRVEQILLNLVDNAVKFTDRGWLRIEGLVIDKHLRISVQDTGIGIQAGDIGKLFKTFRQLEAPATRKHYGTGLGLVICKKLVTMLGGNIRVESEFGVGSKFSFTLPIDKHVLSA